jgi:hypothetical protein
MLKAKPKCSCGTKDAPRLWCYIHGYIKRKK